MTRLSDYSAAKAPGSRVAPIAILALVAACAGAPPPPLDSKAGPPPRELPRPPAPIVPVVETAAALPPPVEPASAQPAAEPPPPLPPNTAVLHIGDSFTLAGFAQALKPRMKALGVRYEVKAETSSFTTSWTTKIELLVANTQPDLVIINLGANEVANADPRAHAPAVRRIVKLIGDRPCVWVAPLLWAPDTGIVDVIRTSSAPCRFFDSNALVKQPIPRQDDHIHPTEAGGAIWADAFWAWLEGERAPLSMIPPATPKKKPSPWLLKPAPEDEHATR